MYITEFTMQANYKLLNSQYKIVFSIFINDLINHSNIFSNFIELSLVESKTHKLYIANCIHDSNDFYKMNCVLQLSEEKIKEKIILYPNINDSIHSYIPLYKYEYKLQNSNPKLIVEPYPSIEIYNLKAIKNNNNFTKNSKIINFTYSKIKNFIYYNTISEKHPMNILINWENLLNHEIINSSCIINNEINNLRCEFVNEIIFNNKIKKYYIPKYLIVENLKEKFIIILKRETNKKILRSLETGNENIICANSLIRVGFDIVVDWTDKTVKKNNYQKIFISFYTEIKTVPTIKIVNDKTNVENYLKNCTISENDKRRLFCYVTKNDLPGEKNERYIKYLVYYVPCNTSFWEFEDDQFVDAYINIYVSKGNYLLYNKYIYYIYIFIFIIMFFN